MFIATLFLTARHWKHPKYLPPAEWITCGIFTQWKYYLAIKWNKLLIHVVRWMGHKVIYYAK